MRDMDEAAILQHILNTFDGVNHLTNLGDHFFIYDPQLNLPPNKQMPFATLVTAIGTALETVTPGDASGCYTHCGYPLSAHL